MTGTGRSDEALWEAELRALREEIKEIRSEQQELARAIDELLKTFRSLATHLGIAAEPYRRSSTAPPARDLPGFA